MSRLRRIARDGLLVSTLAMASSAAAAGAASASTFYVSPSGNDSHSCTSAAEPCKTIDKAIEKSEAAPPPATIEVAAGTYKEEVAVRGAGDNGLTIDGAGSGASGTKIEGKGKSATGPTVEIMAPEASITLAHLSIVNPSEDEKPAMTVATGLTLNDVTVAMLETGSAAGIQAQEFGSLAINGGSVTMGSGSIGPAIFSGAVPVTMSNTAVTVSEGAKGSGIEVEIAPLSLTNVTVSLGAGAKSGVMAGFGPISLNNVAINDGAAAGGEAVLFLAPQSASAKGLKVAMTNAANGNPAVALELGSAEFGGLEVSGAWTGPALVAEGGTLTVSDGRLATSAASTAPVIAYRGASENRGLLLQRTIARAGGTSPAVLVTDEGNATVDSSELLGGLSGALLAHGEGRTRTLTIAGSTIDAGTPGVRDAGAHGVTVVAEGTKNSTAAVRIEGSIVLESQLATISANNNANVTCSYSDVPSQSQAATATEGAIDCANGSSGNKDTEPLTSLFASPITSYNLLAGSPAVDSVPVSAISLPFGLTPSSTDLVGGPRSRMALVGGVCSAVQDMGAIELAGNPAPCPPPSSPSSSPAPAKPPVPAIGNLKLSPSAFCAAPSGATIAKAKHPKKKCGATVSYSDSQAATTTFTVLRPEAGRMQGRSCKKPSKKNKRGKRCTLYRALGSFTHSDVAGLNRFKFSGRIGGKKLAKGSYILQAVPHNSAGNGKAVGKHFKIKS